MASDEVLNLIESGKVCVTRGPSCDLDFRITSKQLQFQEMSQEALSEELGHFVHEVPWWAQLPVSPSLKLPVPSCPATKWDFSIKIHDTLPVIFSSEHPQADISPAADLHVPECVPVLKLVGINFLFTFEPIRDWPLTILTKEVAITDGVNLDDTYETDEDNFEDIMDLSASDFLFSHHKAPLDPSPLPEDKPLPEGCFVEDDNIVTVNNDLLLYQNEHDNDALLTPEASKTFDSQQGTKLPGSAKPYSVSNLENEPSLKLVTAKEFTDVAIRTLLGGRQIKSLPNIKIRRPRPIHPLSAIMPLLWSPGFKNLMSQRCVFLNTISNTLASISKKVQLPCLRKKLAIVQESSIARNAAAQTPRLNKVIQAHLFRMMHTSLYEPISARRLRPGVVEQRAEKETIKSPPTKIQCDVVSPNVGIYAVDDSADVEFEDMFGEELLSDDEIDMLFDLEIQRNQQRESKGVGCSMLLESAGGSCSMLLGSEMGHEDITMRSEEDGGMFSPWETQQSAEDGDNLDDVDFWNSNVLDGMEDSEMIMDTNSDMDLRDGLVYEDGSYVDHEAIFI